MSDGKFYTLILKHKSVYDCISYILHEFKLIVIEITALFL